MGWENVHIEVVERFACETRQELLEREQHYIRGGDNKCLNDYSAHQTDEQLKQKKSDAQRLRRTTQTDEDRERRRMRHNELQQKRRSS